MVLHELVALSLFPVARLRRIVAQLRDGHSAADLLDFHCADRRRPTREADDPERMRTRAASAIARASAAGLRAIAWTDPDYPAPLLTIADPPLVLWIRGSVETLTRPTVAIVGARAASAYGLAVAERLAADLSSRGVLVASGLARGVDAAAHRGALAGGGSTVAVLGSGVDVLYPREHRALADQIAVSGAIVSELTPGTPPQAHFFPQRNRIISGLSRAVVVVEAGEKSGSLITARCALDQGREVLAVPGNILTGRNTGGHALIRDGARIVESADDVLEELGLVTRGDRPATPGGKEMADQDPVLGAIPPGESCDLDRISADCGLPASRILSHLLELELRGLVRRAGTGQFVRVDRTC